MADLIGGRCPYMAHDNCQCSSREGHQSEHTCSVSHADVPVRQAGNLTRDHLNTTIAFRSLAPGRDVSGVLFAFAQGPRDTRLFLDDDRQSGYVVNPTSRISFPTPRPVNTTPPTTDVEIQ